VAGTAAARLVGLLDQRAVRCVGVAAIGIGVTAVTPGCVAACCRGVATVGIGVAVASTLARVPATAGLALLLLLRLGLGVGVAIAYLGVAGIGVAAVAARGVGLATLRLRAALMNARLVCLRAGAVLRGALAAAAPV
jgi:hypothetical protein